MALLPWTLALILTWIGTSWALRGIKTDPPHLDAPYGLFPVSILKPLKGIDPGIRENLESFFNVDYPFFEILFSVSDPGDPVCHVVEDLIRKYPRVNARLITGQLDLGPNPKINNLAQSYGQAIHDWILISDSNVRVQSSYLKRLVGHVEIGTGVVTAVIAGVDPKGLGGELEAAYLNSFYARWMRISERFGRPCVVGKTMFFRRSIFARFGGIRALARYLAEDYMAGQAALQLGLKVLIASDPVPQHIGSRSFAEFWSRHVRWGRIRKAQAPLAFLLEPLMTAPVSGVLGALSLSMSLGTPFSAVFVLHLTFWCLVDLKLINRLGSPLRFRTPGIWLLREFLFIPLWIHIASGNRISWRGRELKLLKGGILESVKA